MFSPWTYWHRRAARALARDEGGAGLVEYALILGLVAVGVIVALAFLAGGIGNVFDMVSGTVEDVIAGEGLGGSHVGHPHWCKKNPGQC